MINESSFFKEELEEIFKVCKFYCGALDLYQALGITKKSMAQLPQKFRVIPLSAMIYVMDNKQMNAVEVSQKIAEIVSENLFENPIKDFKKLMFDKCNNCI